MEKTVSIATTAKLHPRTVRLMRELSGPDVSEQTRRDHEEVAEILRKARMEQSVAVANLIATAIAWVVHGVRRLVGLDSVASAR